MLGDKSISKKILIVNKNKPRSPTEPGTTNFMRRYKSHENYLTASKKFGTSTTTIKNKDMAIPDFNNLLNSPGLSKSKELGSNTIKRLSSNFSSNTKKNPFSTMKKNISPDSKVETKMTAYIDSKPRLTVKIPAASKIMNDESIQELNTEENSNNIFNILYYITVDSQEENEIEMEEETQIDQMKSSEFISDFYTNSIGEASCSIIDKGRKLINVLPQPFVKLLENKFVGGEDINKIEGKLIGQTERRKSNVSSCLEKITIRINNTCKSVKSLNTYEIINAFNSTTSAATTNNSIPANIEKIKLSPKVEIIDLTLFNNKTTNTNIANKTLNTNNSTNSITQLTNNSRNSPILNEIKKDKEKEIEIEIEKESEKEKEIEKIKVKEIEIGRESSPKLESYQRKLLISAKKGDRDAFLECLEIILNYPKGDINFKDDSGWTALHHACDEGNLKIVDILIKTNADVNSRANNKKTSLHLATSHGYFDISKLLVESGGGVINSVDDEKNTPIHICAAIGHIELLKYLLDRFPQADAKNIYGKTPVDLAKKDDIKLLLGEYLKKNESHYHKVHIHTTNNKLANNLFKNLNNTLTCNTKETSYNNYLNLSNNKSNMQTSQTLKTPTKTYNPPSLTNPNQNLKQNKNENTNSNRKSLPNNSNQALQNKIQSSSTKSNNEFSPCLPVNSPNGKVQTSAFQNNNININISTNINNPNHNINVVNLNNSNKLKVTVETKMNNSNIQNTSTNKLLSKNSIKSNTSKIMTHTSTSVKFNTYNSNKVLKTSKTKSTLSSNLNTTSIQNLSGVKKNDNEKSCGNLNQNNPSNQSLQNMNTNSKKEEFNVSKDNLNKNGINRINTVSNKEKQHENTIIDISNTDEIYNEDNSNKLEKCDIQNYTLNNPNGTISNLDSEERDNSNMNSCSIDDERIGPSYFICHALLGKGSFGEVYLVEKRNTRTLFAMKVLSKDKIMAQNLVKYAMTERNVLSITNHPFIVKLNYSFQTSDKLFLILEYCPGGDLAEHLARENRFSEERAKIYLCEIILALENLHKRDIIFRDLKPDNVVLDLQGHALLTDFGLSKEGVLDSKSAKSFCGSIAYLAPEMLKRSGHGKAVDWYLLGVLFYEMLVGIPPYFTNNKEQLFKNIEKADLQIPKFVSEEAGNLLRALLQRDPQLRLGYGEEDAIDVKKHNYFNEINWDDVYERKLNPPNPAIRNRIIQQFAKPRVFEDNGSPGVFCLNSQLDSHFDGWSFINNDDPQVSINNITISKK